MEEKEIYIPQPVTSTDIILDAYLSQILEEQKRTNALLASLVSKPKPRPARKKKGDEETCNV